MHSIHRSERRRSPEGEWRRATDSRGHRRSRRNARIGSAECTTAIQSICLPRPWTWLS
ncbi:hypothetical protein NDU88_006308, partial [Pleurodeles waltl]